MAKEPKYTPSPEAMMIIQRMRDRSYSYIHAFEEFLRELENRETAEAREAEDHRGDPYFNIRAWTAQDLATEGRLITVEATVAPTIISEKQMVHRAAWGSVIRSRRYGRGV